MDESSEPLEALAPSRLRIDRPMPGRLAHLHRRSVAVRFGSQGQDRLLRGEGVWENDAQLGAILRIQFPEHPDDGELLVLEREWRGDIESGTPMGCDFLICLTGGKFGD
jgi:hypothetical protein